jgi:hypothetical protein
MCICDADLKGEAFGSYQDRREEESGGMRRRAFFGEPIGKVVKGCAISLDFRTNFA